MTNMNRPMSVHRRVRNEERAAERAKAEKDARLSAEVELILRKSAENVRHLIARETKRRPVDPHFFIGAR